MLSAPLAAATVMIVDPGGVEVLFPAGTLLGLVPGLYDVRISVTMRPETVEIFGEPVEFA